MSIHSSTERDEPPDDGAALLSIPDPPQVPVDLVVTRLFPWPTQGQTFLARFKERAAIERSIIPDLKAGDVVICTKSIATLAEALDLAYDTVQKYVTIFKALGLLQKRTFIDGQIAFILSLGIYLPPKNLEANLEYLLQRSQPKKSRTKFHGLVKDVKERCLAYGLINQEWTSALRQLQALLQPPEKGLSRRTLEQRLTQAQHLVSTMLAQVLTGRLPTGDALLQNLPGLSGKRGEDVCHRVSESTRQEATQRRTSEMPLSNLPDQAPSRDAELLKQGSESTQPGSLSRFAESKAASNLFELPDQVDSSLHGPSRESTQTDSPGRRLDGHDAQNLPKPLTQIDSALPDHRSESIQTAHSDRFAASSDTENPSARSTSVDSQALANVNVGNVITNNMNVNVEIVAAFLCQLFNEPPSKQGIYSKLFREGYNQAEVIHAAAIFTLVHFHREKTISNPAAVFVARCKAYHKTGIPAETAELLAEYGALTYQQQLDKAQRCPPQTTQPSAPARAAPSGWRTSLTLPPIPRPTDLAPRIALKPSGGMTRERALRLRAQIAHDRRVGMCQTGIAALSDGTYAVLLDNTVSAARVRQAALYTVDEWQARSQEVCAALFASGGRDLAKRRFCVRTPETQGGERS